jgi:hypothetical protein
VEEREKRRENKLGVTSCAGLRREKQCARADLVLNRSITEMVCGPLSSFLDPVCIATFLPPAVIFPERALSRGNFLFAPNPLHQASNPILLKPNRFLSTLI